jgi:hypothetical protein
MKAGTASFARFQPPVRLKGQANFPPPPRTGLLPLLPVIHLLVALKAAPEPALSTHFWVERAGSGPTD